MAAIESKPGITCNEIGAMFDRDPSVRARMGEVTGGNGQSPGGAW